MDTTVGGYFSGSVDVGHKINQPYVCMLALGNSIDMISTVAGDRFTKCNQEKNVSISTYHGQVLQSNPKRLQKEITCPSKGHLQIV